VRDFSFSILRWSDLYAVVRSFLTLGSWSSRTNTWTTDNFISLLAFLGFVGLHLFYLWTLPCTCSVTFLTVTLFFHQGLSRLHSFSSLRTLINSLTLCSTQLQSHATYPYHGTQILDRTIVLFCFSR
jgi:hypothetical protein